MKKNPFLILFFLTFIFFADYSKADYWLIIELRQGPGGRPEVRENKSIITFYTYERLGYVIR